MHQWLSQALKTSGISQAELARRLSESLGRSIDRAAVNKMLATKGKRRKLDADEMVAIAQITRFPLPEPEEAEAEATVPLVGRVAAGSAMILFAEGQDPGERVRAPEGATADTVAAEIHGSSLGELFDRWLVYYDRRQDPPTSDLIGRLCVVGLADGRILVKKLQRGRRGEGHFDLHSNTEPPMYDQVVEWAARVKQMMPR